ncbi:Peter pan protein [Giardia muris]|uniref:Peter pan protein n=1 Tax=Giardia muris TaxID=5742 RepID=A0A4Z1TBF5_GIAMU|nr:Peter pan protein [Giardia muris]|eukprot:TNJ29861.1 Peter pan protein [Giardia muris]
MADVDTPQTFVFKRGRLAHAASLLVGNLQLVFYPNGYSRLKARKSNTLRDFLAVAGSLGVTHLLVFTSSGEGTTLRIIKTPHGPTLTFRLVEYSSMQDLHAAQGAPVLTKRMIDSAPLCIMAGFGDVGKETKRSSDEQKAIQLCATTIKAMYPEVSVTTAGWRSVKRCVLYSADKTGLISFRHYLVRYRIADASGGLISVFQEHNLALGSLESIKDIQTLQRPEPTDLLECFFSDKPFQLIEVGPRMKLKLLKIEAGVSSGMVLYHAYVTKTAEQVAASELKAAITRNRMEKEARLDIRRRVRRLEEESRNIARTATARQQTADNLAYYAAEREAELSESLGDSPAT